MTVRVIAILALVVAVASSSHVPTMKRIPRETFRKEVRAHPEAKHAVVFAVKQNNLDVLDKELIERSTPGSPKYQQWMSFDEIGAIIDTEEGAKQVKAWLAEHGANILWSTKRNEYIKAEAPVSVWEELLSAEFYEFNDESRTAFRAKGGKKKLLRTDEYTIPEAMKPHLSAVFHTVQTPPEMRNRHHIPDKLAKKRRSGSLRTDLTVSLAPHGAKLQPMAQGVVTVDFLSNYYYINVTGGSSAQQQSVFETSEEHFSPNDLEIFQEHYDLPVQDCEAPYGYTTTDCTNNDCYEGNLDVQYIMGVAQQTTTIYWYVDNSDPEDDPFVDWATDVADSTDPPLSNSISWGSLEQANTVDTLSAFNTEALKLANMGVTTMVSSGDDGVAGDGQYCNYNSGSAIYGMWTGTPWTGYGYFPSFPATSPYVVAVGATMGPESGDEEKACESDEGGVITTGGGFSGYYPTPSWQRDAVNDYFDGLDSDQQPTSGYNRKGRGYPDVSMIGVWYQTVVQNQMVSLFGTSASAPVFASMISLINAARAARNMSSVGFINPTLYAAGKPNNNLGVNGTSLDAYNDVVKGDNKCTAGTPLVCCDSGFYATQGWDPVTGFGSVFYPNLAIMFGLDDYQYIDPTINPGDDDGGDNAAAPGAKLGLAAAGLSVLVGALALFLQNYLL